MKTAEMWAPNPTGAFFTLVGWYRFPLPRPLGNVMHWDTPQGVAVVGTPVLYGKTVTYVRIILRSTRDFVHLEEAGKKVGQVVVERNPEATWTVH